MRKNKSGIVFAGAVMLLASCQMAGNTGHRKLITGICENKEVGEQGNTPQPRQAESEKTESVRADDDLLMQQVPAGTTSQILRREGYVVSYNQNTRIPNWVAWELTADHTTGLYKRKGIDFHSDEEADGPRVTTLDYARSGYDRGHMCPSGDNKWSQRAQEQSFLLTNMCPQNHQLNTGDWNEMESQCRRWAKQYGSVYVVAGPILLNKKHKIIGKNRVTVPEAFFKVVLCLQGTPKGIGFIYRNESGNRPKGDNVNSIDQIERITGMDFFAALPDEIEQAVEQQQDLTQW